MFAKIIAFFKKLFGIVDPITDEEIAAAVADIPYVKPESDSDIAEEDEPVVSDEEALATLESTEELPKGVRLIDGERHFWSAITGWTKSPTSGTYPRQIEKTPIEGPPFAWNLAGQIGQPRFKPDDWEEKGPDFDVRAYNAKYF